MMALREPWLKPMVMRVGARNWAPGAAADRAPRSHVIQVVTAQSDPPALYIADKTHCIWAYLSPACLREFHKRWANKSLTSLKSALVHLDSWSLSRLDLVAPGHVRDPNASRVLCLAVHEMRFLAADGAAPVDAPSDVHDDAEVRVALGCLGAGEIAARLLDLQQRDGLTLHPAVVSYAAPPAPEECATSAPAGNWPAAGVSGVPAGSGSGSGSGFGSGSGSGLVEGFNPAPVAGTTTGGAAWVAAAVAAAPEGQAGAAAAADDDEFDTLESQAALQLSPVRAPPPAFEAGARVAWRSPGGTELRGRVMQGAEGEGDDDFCTVAVSQSNQAVRVPRGELRARAPGSRTPGSRTPGSRTPGSRTPGSRRRRTPQSGARKPSTPQRSTPQSSGARKPSTPQSAAPQRSTPLSTAARKATPQSAAPQRSTPLSAVAKTQPQSAQRTTPLTPQQTAELMLQTATGQRRPSPMPDLEAEDDDLGLLATQAPGTPATQLSPVPEEVPEEASGGSGASGSEEEEEFLTQASMAPSPDRPSQPSPVVGPAASPAPARAPAPAPLELAEPAPAPSPAPAPAAAPAGAWAPSSVAKKSSKRRARDALEDPLLRSFLAKGRAKLKKPRKNWAQQWLPQ